MPAADSTDPVTAAFGRCLREARLAQGLTLEGLAELSGLHWTYVGSVERGQRNISLRNIVRLADALELDPALLVGGITGGTTRRRK